MSYELVFPSVEDEAILKQVNDLILRYAEMGLMLGQTIEFFMKVAASGLLIVAVDEEGNVKGSAGLTYKLQPIEGAYEFGAWAVEPDTKGTGLGKKLYEGLFEKVAANPEIKQVIAYANENSRPILVGMGGTEIDQTTLPDGMFFGCMRCNCQGKEHLPEGQRCVDRLIDLTRLVDKYRAASTD
jgi:N-acetylglutamate synthase-like GNAT family acetyltransferase